MTTTRITFSAKSGSETSGEVAAPSATKAPGLVLIQEYWGVNDHIRDLASRLANEGFYVLAPDLYHGKVTKSGDEAGKLMAALDWKRAIDEIAGAVAFLKKSDHTNGHVGIIGFCMGGALTFASAAAIPELEAAVPFYGVPDPSTDYSKIHAPVQAHFSNKDEWAALSKGEAIKKKIEAAGKSMELNVYDASHAFVNNTRPEVYNPDAAKLAWGRAVDFLKKNLAS